MTATPYYQDESVTLHHGDALTVLSSLPDASVNCCVTSPPYFGLRDYGVEGQLGLEASPAQYVKNMRALFAQARRVLADDGTFWLNLGDSYNTSGTRQGHSASAVVGEKQHAKWYGRNTSGLPNKNLLGIPWRVAFALQDDGWILRQEVIWSKRNCMPEAVKDRPSRSHETLFLFSKKPRYWYDADAIREDSGQPGNVNSAGVHSRPGKPGRNARSVWTISSQPTPFAHFATMPLALAERCVLAGTKPGGTVLDPFSGSGTTGLAAARHGRKYVGIDLNAQYLDLSLRTRLTQPRLDFDTKEAI